MYANIGGWCNLIFSTLVLPQTRAHLCWKRNDAPMKTDDSEASCQVHEYTGREERQTKRYRGLKWVLWMFGVYIFKHYPHCSFVPDSHLASSQDCATCQGLPWATDRALCGWDWILWRISGIWEDKQTATVYFLVCCRTSICLYRSSSLLYLLESWRGQGQQGENQQSEGILSSSQCLCGFYSALFQKGSKIAVSCSCYDVKGRIFKVG